MSETLCNIDIGSDSHDTVESVAAANCSTAEEASSSSKAVSISPSDHDASKRSSSATSKLGSLSRDALLGMLAAASDHKSRTAEADSEYSNAASECDTGEDILSMSTLSAISASSYCYIESDEERVHRDVSMEGGERINDDLHTVSRIDLDSETLSAAAYDVNSDGASSTQQTDIMSSKSDSSKSRQQLSVEIGPQSRFLPQPNSRPRSAAGRTVIVVGRHTRQAAGSSSRKRSASATAPLLDEAGRGRSRVPRRSTPLANNDSSAEIAGEIGATDGVFNTTQDISIVSNMLNLFTSTIASDVDDVPNADEACGGTGDSGGGSPVRRFIKDVVLPMSGAFMTSMAVAFAAGFCVDYFLLQHSGMDPTANNIELITALPPNMLQQQQHPSSPDRPSASDSALEPVMACAF